MGLDVHAYRQKQAGETGESIHYWRKPYALCEWLEQRYSVDIEKNPDECGYLVFLNAGDLDALEDFIFSFEYKLDLFEESNDERILFNDYNLAFLAKARRALKRGYLVSIGADW